MATRKVIVTCAVTGSAFTPTMSPYLPITPEEISESAIGAAQAGASIVHLHARNPKNGMPTSDLKIYMEFLPHIKQNTQAVISITTGGGLNMDIKDRLAAALKTQPEMCSLNLGSMNVGFYPALKKYKKWKYQWEPHYLENSRNFVFRNTFGDIEYTLKELGEGCGTRFEFECYDVGHLYTLAHFLDRKLIKPPLFVQTVFGILGGIGAEVDNLVFMRRTANRLLGNTYQWSILGEYGGGCNQMALAVTGANMGGHVRVGLEDNLYIDKGKLAKSNAEQVRKIRMILENLSLEIATPAETRKILELKGAKHVVF